MAAETVFVDTNVLVYADLPASAHHIVARDALRRLQKSNRPLCISSQVLREYLSAVTRPDSSGHATPMQEAIASVAELRSLLNVVQERSDTLDRLLDLLANHPTAGKQVHDANLVATMLSAGIPALLTFNTRDFRRFEDVIRLEQP